jgi:hypothetical protein
LNKNFGAPIPSCFVYKQVNAHPNLIKTTLGCTNVCGLGQGILAEGDGSVQLTSFLSTSSSDLLLLILKKKYFALKKQAILTRVSSYPWQGQSASLT